MTSRSGHRSPNSEIIDFQTLVWPPPELRPGPQPLSVHTGGNQPYEVYPGQGSSTAHRAAGFSPRIDTASSNETTLNNYNIKKQAPVASRDYRRHLSPPPRAPSRQATGPSGTPYNSDYGCKEYPAGYAPTPRPYSPPPLPRVSQTSSNTSSYPLDSHTNQKGGSQRNLNFFQPFEPSPYPVGSVHAQEGFMSPIVENGKIIGHSYISGGYGLSPGGYIERTPNFASSPEPSSSVIYFPENCPTDYSPSISSYYSTSPKQRIERYDRSKDWRSKPFTPTRPGYWNRRGDNLLSSGQVIYARPSEVYPPDLATYPENTFVNETGTVGLPESGDERINTWRKNTRY